MAQCGIRNERSGLLSVWKVHLAVSQIVEPDLQIPPRLLCVDNVMNPPAAVSFPKRFHVVTLVVMMLLLRVKMHYL